MAQALGKKNAKEPIDFITALRELMTACGVDDLKMSDYGITLDEFETMTANAQTTMGRLFLNDRIPLEAADCMAIYQKSYR